MEFEQSAVGNSSGFRAIGNGEVYLDFWAIGNWKLYLDFGYSNRQLVFFLDFHAIGNSIGNLIWLSRQSAVGYFIWISGDWQLEIYMEFEQSVIGNSIRTSKLSAV